jgi:hypothetical protein
VEVTGSSRTSCLKRSLKNVLSNVTYSPSHRQPGAFMINIQSTLRTAPDLCEYVSHAVLFGGYSISYSVSAQSDACIYAQILHNVGGAGRAREININKLGQHLNASCQGNRKVRQRCWKSMADMESVNSVRTRRAVDVQRDVGARSCNHCYC